MSVKGKITAAAVALTVAGGISMAVPPAAHAATPECANSPALTDGCIDIFSALYGTNAHPGYVLEVQGGGNGRIGQPVVLARASAGNPAEDFVTNAAEPVSDFFQAGLAAEGLALRYGCKPDIGLPTCPPGAVDDVELEFDYSPDGVPSHLCPGVASDPFDGTPVTLQYCGISNRTLWIINPVTPPATTPPACADPLFNGLVTLISGATDSSFANPYTLSQSSYPGPGAPLFTFPLYKNFKNEEWGANDGVIGASCPLP
jgi:hypothetical protein